MCIRDSPSSLSRCLPRRRNRSRTGDPALTGSPSSSISLSEPSGKEKEKEKEERTREEGRASRKAKERDLKVGSRADASSAGRKVTGKASVHIGRARDLAKLPEERKLDRILGERRRGLRSGEPSPILPPRAAVGRCLLRSALLLVSR